MSTLDFEAQTFAQICLMAKPPEKTFEKLKETPQRPVYRYKLIGVR